MTAKTTTSRPSRMLGIENEWIAYQLDSAISLFGNVIEAASQEREEVGPKGNKSFMPKYTLAQLLDPDFRLPTDSQQGAGGSVEALKRMPGMRAFKVNN